MAKNEIDVVDVAPLVLLPIAAGMVLGVWSFGISLFGTYDFAAPVFTIGTTGISAAFLLTLASVGAIVFTNELDGSSYENYEYGAIIFALAAVPLYVFVPAVTTLIDGSDILAFVVWLAIAAVATALAYIE